MTKQFHTARGARGNRQKQATMDQLQEEIRRLAYTFYCEGGYEHGHDFEHWIEAERRVLERHQKIRGANV